MTETPPAPTESRRDLLKKAVVAGGVMWAVPVVDSFITPAAAGGSGVITMATTTLNKWTNGNNAQPSLTALCQNGSIANAGRGSVVFTRDSATNTISATVTLSTGTNITGRFVTILQSTCPSNNAMGTCANTPVVNTGPGAPKWAATPSQGPQTFGPYPIINGATCFVFLLSVSGGGGNEDYASKGPTYLPG